MYNYLETDDLTCCIYLLCSYSMHAQAYYACMINSVTNLDYAIMNSYMCKHNHAKTQTKTLMYSLEVFSLRVRLKMSKLQL